MLGACRGNLYPCREEYLKTSVTLNQSGDTKSYRSSSGCGDTDYSMAYLNEPSDGYAS